MTDSLGVAQSFGRARTTATVASDLRTDNTETICPSSESHRFIAKITKIYSVCPNVFVISWPNPVIALTTEGFGTPRVDLVF
ncbi:unnamed protein product [Protopolystoma xenopodis]|uniref:Uncharacterized protein n=1 Tax=Protopolystoma xenopodis TaxID=117903 RepID=A0A3S5FH33_9PLAT|nr:unnamed protein product [Protopolystoma xenopodis]